MHEIDDRNLVWNAGSVVQRWKHDPRMALINLDMLVKGFRERGLLDAAALCEELAGLLDRGQARGPSGTRRELAVKISRLARAVAG